MNSLMDAINRTIKQQHQLPFSVYRSIKEQHLVDVPVPKPLLIAILSGDKKLGNNAEITCHSGDFIFLSDNPAINMRNIPKEHEYFALLIEFDYQDFIGLHNNLNNNNHYCSGKITQPFEKCLQQFVEWSHIAPPSLWHLRRKEIIQLLYHMGHKNVLSMISNKKTTHKLHQLISELDFDALTMAVICDKLAMSESTLRRKLKSEGTSLQQLKDQTKLAQALHLLQTTDYSVALIAEKCGYLSQSRFTDRFKGRFGLTPSELRKTKMVD